MAYCGKRNCQKRNINRWRSALIFRNQKQYKNMATIKQQKAEAQKKLNELADKEHAELVKKHYARIKADYEGKCFREKTSYGGDTKTFYRYQKVMEIKPEDLYTVHNGRTVTAHIKVMTFAKDSYGRISVEPSNDSYLHALGKRIKDAVFKNALTDIIMDLELLQ